MHLDVNGREAGELLIFQKVPSFARVSKYSSICGPIHKLWPFNLTINFRFTLSCIFTTSFRRGLRFPEDGKWLCVVFVVVCGDDVNRLLMRKINSGSIVGTCRFDVELYLQT